ncbi:MAG: hypothetical protein JW852_10980 [Spirochaetales bacterium]|nr:hypothetical protein [Spirochaetales bacterium]
MYLPPGYHKEETARYPVIYFLHGYGQDHNHLPIDSKTDIKKGIPFLARIVLRRVLNRIIYFETLDRLISEGVLPPFLLVQPDGGLHLPRLFDIKNFDGTTAYKGSMYWNSARSGMYRSYIFEDVIDFVDKAFRTIPEKRSRFLAGGSMGGYGAMLGGIFYPHLFNAAVGLSPSICCLDILDIDLVVPFTRLLFGKKAAIARGEQEKNDIIDSCDLVFSKTLPLAPTIERDGNGRVLSMDKNAEKDWAETGLDWLVENTKGAFEDVRVMVSCEASDEFGFAQPAVRFHNTLTRAGIEHEFEIYTDKLASRYSPHMFGIAFHILEALRFCLPA